jgi:bacillolysin
MKRLVAVVALLVIALPMLYHSAFAAPPIQERTTPAERLARQSNGMLTIHMNDALGTARFMEAGEHPITGEFAGRKMEPETIARTFMQSYGSLFGVNDADLSVMSIKSDELGMTHVRFAQSLGGVPVFGGEVTVHIRADGAIATVGGSTVQGLSPFSSQISLSAERATEIAQLQAAILDGQVTEKQLIAYNDGLVTGRAAPTVMAYFLKVESAAAPELAQNVLVDAQSGAVLLSFSATYDGRDRRTYNMQRRILYSQAVLTRSEGQGSPNSTPGCTPADINNAHDSAGEAYTFFQSRFGRDSYDNSGATIHIYTCYGTNYRNAFWDGSRLVFGEGFALADDLVAHEFSHAITEHSSGLHYVYQSGALNESYSDVFGESLDLTNGRGTDSKGVRWEIGEDIPGLTTRRNMSYPNRYNHADRVSSHYYYCGTGDNGGVHLNSGVPNKAYTMLIDGGTFNGYHIKPIGMEQALRIYYRTNEYYLGQSSQFVDNYNYLIQACGDLYGSASFTCSEVRDAVNAVEMNQPACQ